MTADGGPRRGPAWWARWLHFYVSAVGFAGILFFGVTGFTLNHADVCESGEPVVRELEGVLEPARLAAGSPASAVDKLAVAERLRADHGLRGEVRDFQIDEAECTVIFVGPAYSADAFIDRATGRYRLQESRKSSVALFDDLHKGRYSGPVWSVLIDVFAAVTTLSAATGLWLLCYVRRRRLAGTAAVVVGAAALYAVYALGIR